MNKKKYIKHQLKSIFNFLPIDLKSFDELKQKKDIVIQQHKNFIKSKFLPQPGNFTTLISILPFILGFSQFLNQKYSSQKNNLFFEQNLPGITFPTHKIHWDTFQYLFRNKKNNEFLSELEKNKITWSDKDIIISTQNKDLFTSYVEKNLIAYTKKFENSSELTINSKWDKLLSQESNLNLINSFYQNLDEIPLKLEASYPTHASHGSMAMPTNSSIKPLIFPSNLLFTSIENSKKSINKNNLSIQKKELNPTILHAFKTKNVQLDCPVNQFKTINLDDRFQNSFLQKKQKDFISNKSLLISEVRKLFINNNLVPSISLVAKTSKLVSDPLVNTVFLKTEDFAQFQEITREIDNILLPKPANFSRFMSGYQYPDMNLNEVICFILQKNTSKIYNLKILLPSSYLFPQPSNFKHTPPPAYLVKSKKLILKDALGREIFYEGPSVVLNKEAGFDWKINSSSLKLWIENYLGAKNPTHLTSKNFFGIFESPEYLNTIAPKNFLGDNYDLETLLVFQNGLITNPSSSYLPFVRSFQLPDLSRQDWEKQLLKDSNSKDLNSVQYNTVILPIFEVRTPKLENPFILYGYKNSLDFEFIHPLRSIFQSKINNSFLNNLNQMDFHLNGSNFGDDHSFPIHLTSGTYQKIPSLFQRNSKVFFSDIWEPLTFKSWLITAQIGFAFLVFKILKALADNYGRELLVYLLDLVALLGFLDDDLKQEIEILMGQREKGFRIISKTTKNFNNIGGIQNLLPEIVEIVWFLRNSGREFSISKTLPRGVLLTGPPGTGKTLLVQAIAGEAEVPVLALSGSSLVEPGESGALKLEILFQEARKTAPCIVFIDEMDTLAQKRDQVLQNPMGADEILESLSNIKPSTNLASSNFSSNISENSEEITDAIFAQQDMHKEKLRILMQFLVELDGIQGRDGVVVIGATNRPEMLDPAILRPGRFDRILDLGLPGPEKRREILKLYSENLGINESISWNYLIHRTAGYSAADLAGIMNQSTLHAILKNSQHTIETIEYGIDRITTIGLEKPQKPETQKFLATQVAYYQAGKIVLSALLEHHPPTLVTHLWPRRTNVRALQINENLQKYFFRFARRIELEHRIIGCYAGKAAEILFLQDNLHLNNLSDLGTEDIQFAQNLIKYMIQNWYFYGKTSGSHENLNILNIFNEKEYRDLPEKLPFLNSVLESNELSLINKGELFGKNSYASNSLIENSIEQDPQTYFPTASWQYQISNEFEISTRAFSDWYRLYLPDPQQTERNLEWTPPDEFYHGNDFSEKLTESVTWNQISSIQIDYETHSLILQSFNKALLLLDQNREILDKLAYELLKSEILREPEIEKILHDFDLTLQTSEKIASLEKIKFSENNKIPIYPSWGSNSRRPYSYSINLKFTNET
nr:ATP-dependent zinc metalloprotease FtsH [Chlorella desiccata (nom. nud.)]